MRRASIAMKKTKLTRSLLAACSIVALSAVMYGCVGGGDDSPGDGRAGQSDMDAALGVAQMDAMTADGRGHRVPMVAEAAAAKAGRALAGSLPRWMPLTMQPGQDVRDPGRRGIPPMQATMDSGVAASVRAGDGRGSPRRCADEPDRRRVLNGTDAQVVVTLREVRPAPAMAARTAAGDARSHAANGRPLGRRYFRVGDEASAELASEAEMAASDAEGASTAADAATTGAAAMAQRSYCGWRSKATRRSTRSTRTNCMRDVQIASTTWTSWMTSTRRSATRKLPRERPQAAQDSLDGGIRC